jgi:hypothetical protein
MEIMISQYLSPIVVIGCLCVGYVLKNLVPGDGINRFIPLIMAVLGIVAAGLAASALSLEIVVQGMISGLASTGLYEAFANIIPTVLALGTKEEEEDK